MNEQEIYEVMKKLDDSDLGLLINAYMQWNNQEILQIKVTDKLINFECVGLIVRKKGWKCSEK